MKSLIIVSLLFLSNIGLKAQMLVVWKETHPGVWKAVVGKTPKHSLLKAAGGQVNLKALQQLPKMPFPLDKGAIEVKIIQGKTYLKFPLQRDEQIYGLGLNFQTVNQRGRILNLHMDHFDGKDNGRNHAPVPFYVSSKGYGVLIDAAKYITVYAGTGVRLDAKNPPELQDRNTNKQWSAQPYSDAVEVLVPANGTNLYVFAGPTPMYVVQRYNLLNGGGYLPPKWGLGFTQRVPTLFTQEDILKEVANFESHDFPLDFIGLEPGWHSMSYPCTFEWDKTRFPNPKVFLEQLAAKGISANLWMNPYVSPKSSLYPLVRKLTGSHTVWNGLVPDFTLAKTRQVYKNHFRKNHIDLGVGGYKIDEVDGYDNWIWPDVATFPSGTSGEEMRQMYGSMVQKMTADWFKEINKRTYGLVRGSNAGASHLPYVIYNDYYNHKDFITALVNSSFIGVLWTPEVRASKNAEEWVRRMQSACFSPMAMINAWADGTKPWSFAEVTEAVKEVANLRMQLLPYLYTTFAAYKLEGKPPFRAMQLVEGFVDQSAQQQGELDATNNPYQMAIRKDIKDQYMMGDYMLVAPMFAGEKTRQVILPKGKWFDFYTGTFVGENQLIQIQSELNKIPLFVRDGGIIPMVPVHRQAPKPGEKWPLELRHYGYQSGEFTLYDDDGRTFDFEKGAYSLTRYSVKKDAQGKLVGSQPMQAPMNYLREVNWVFMTP